MQKSKVSLIISAIAVLSFAAFAVIYWNRSIDSIERNVQEHARIVARSVWDLSRQTTSEYLNIVASHSSYQSITIRDAEGRIFAKAEIPDHSQLDRLLINLHLIPETLLSAPITFNGHSLGRVDVIWYNRAIYTYLISLLFITLFLSSLNMYFRTLSSKKNLEKEVLNRTRSLFESDQKFRAIFDNHYQLSGLISPDGILISANRSSLELINCKAEDVEGLSFCDCPWWPKGSPLHDIIKQAVHEAQDGQFVRKELSFKDINGLHRVVDFSLKPVFDKDHNLIYIVPEGRDITGLKFAQQEILSQKKFSDAVIESLPGIFYICNDKLQLIRWNNMFEFISGYSTEDLDHKSVLDFFSPADTDILLQKVQNRMNKVEVPPTELSAVAQDGTTHPFLFTSSMVIMDNKKYLIGTGVDISARKRVEAELQQAQKMEAIGTLAGGIAHDFNNILSAIIGYTELSQLETAPQTKITGFLAGIHQAAIRARDLVQQILTFSRKQDNSHLPLRIAPLVNEALRLIRSSIPATINIETNIAAREATIRADPTQIHQIIVNLCTNGYQAIGDEYGTLRVSLQEVSVNEEDSRNESDPSPGHYVLIQVSDTGIGMDDETLQRIFEPYFTTKETGKGTGLGLALVNSIVQEHNGTIAVESTVDKGTTISIYLNLLETSGQYIPEPQLPPPGDAPSREYHILCVDDEPYILNILDEFLQEQGYRVTSFEKGTDALAYLDMTKEQVDLVITDMTMPEMSGLELGRKIFSVRSHLPVMLCTGYSHSINRDMAIEQGFARYIEKPLILADLVFAIEEVLAERSPDRPEAEGNDVS